MSLSRRSAIAMPCAPTAVQTSSISGTESDGIVMSTTEKWGAPLVCVEGFTPVTSLP